MTVPTAPDKFRKAIVGMVSEAAKASREEVDSKIETPSGERGDYAVPCFFLAKTMGKAPPHVSSELAEALMETVKSSRLIGKVEAEGPYLNFFVDRPELALSVISEVLSSGKKYGSSKTYAKTAMVEYFHANTHKAVHIGHIRNICLGECLCRILEFTGDKVVRVNYQGDIGPHVAKCIWGMLNLKQKVGSPPGRNRLRWLGSVYAVANRQIEDDEQLEREAKQLLLKIYAGDKALNSLWKKTRKWCLDEFQEMYGELGVQYERLYFESEMEFPAREISRQLLKKSVAVESDGAIIVDLKEYGLGVFVLLTRDGTALYSSKDIALAKTKYSRYKLDSSIHLVGKEQELHFKQLFKTLELMGGDDKKFAEKSRHLIYGLVMLPTGKMSSRQGSVVFYDDLRAELISRASSEVKKRHADWPKKKIEDSAKKIAFAALKFAMINRDNERVLVFDWEQSLKLEGETGPYVQYAYARIRSIMRKHGRHVPGLKSADFSQLSGAAEIKIVKLLREFPALVAAASSQLKPAIIPRYLLDLTQAFSSFYNDHPILKAEPEIRDARLLLCAAVKQVLENGLSLMAIDVLEEM